MSCSLRTEDLIDGFACLRQISTLQIGLGKVADEMTSMLELPPSARALSRVRSAYQRFSYEVRHPENHKQLVRFLCVGASGYVVNLISFFILVHPLQAADKLAFVVAAVIASTNNFFWNRHWTFRAKEDHPVRQAVRF